MEHIPFEVGPDLIWNGLPLRGGFGFNGDDGIIEGVALDLESFGLGHNGIWEKGVVLGGGIGCCGSGIIGCRVACPNAQTSRCQHPCQSATLSFFYHI